MTRRTVFSRILGAVGFAVAAKVMPFYPRSGQPRVVALSRVHEQDIAGEILSAGGYKHLQLPIEPRPCLTINRIPQFIRMVTKEQRDESAVTYREYMESQRILKAFFEAQQREVRELSERHKA